jgi:hypothetical protein
VRLSVSSIPPVTTRSPPPCCPLSLRIHRGNHLDQERTTAPDRVLRWSGAVLTGGRFGHARRVAAVRGNRLRDRLPAWLLDRSLMARNYDSTFSPFSSRMESTMHEIDPAGVSPAEAVPVVDASMSWRCPGSIIPVRTSVLPRRSVPLFQATVAV